MGGRGGSALRRRRSRVAGLGIGLANPANQQDDTQQAATQDNSSSNTAGPTLDEFQKASGQDFDNMMNSIQGVQVSNGLDTKLQRTIQYLGLNEKPVVLSNDEFDKRVKTDALDGVEIYRGLMGNSSMSSSDMVEYLKFGENTLAGKGIHGDGFYFSTSRGTGKIYSDGRPNSVATAYIDKSKAKVVTESKLIRMFDRESDSVKANFGYRTRGRDSVLAQYALWKDYNVIHAPGGNATHSGTVNHPSSHKNGGEDFYVPLVRSVLVIRDKTKVGRP